MRPAVLLRPHRLRCSTLTPKWVLSNRSVRRILPGLSAGSGETRIRTEEARPFGVDFNALLQIQSASEAVVPKLAGTLSEGGALLARQIHFIERPSAPVEMAIHLSTMAWNASSS